MKTKKMFSKVFALLLAVITVLAMSVTAFADDGSITITNAAKGETYNLYKIFDATVTGTEDGSISYQLMSGKTQPPAGFTIDNAGNVSATNGTSFDGKKTDDVSALISYAGDPVEKVTAKGSQVAFSGLDYGYYLITTSQGATLITVCSTNPSASVIDKNSTNPSTENLKTFADGTESKSVSIGDKVGYKLSLTTKNFDKNNNKIMNYTFVDSATNVTIDTRTIVVKAGDETLTEGKDYTVTTNGKEVTINVIWATETTGNSTTTITSKYNNNIALTVTYSAEVTSIDSDGKAKNSARWSYNNGTPSTPDTPKVDTYKITVNKVKSDGTSLTGAKFALYDSLTNGNLIPLVKEKNGNYRVATQAERDAESGFTSETIEAGTAVIEGLGNGTYYLEETKAPNGYNKLTARSTITINGDNKTEKVVNNAGSELPSTGGIGTTIFYVVGGILVAGAAIALVVRKRMSSYQD